MRKINKKCIFLENNRCKIYKIRPTACVFFPFLIESDEEIYLPKECKSGKILVEEFYMHIITEILRRFLIKNENLSEKILKILPFDERIVVLKHMFQIFMNGLPNLCSGCSECCKNLKVELTVFDIYRISNKLKIPTKIFIREFCKKEGNFVLKKKNDKCVFLENERCKIYESRPAVCVMYPFMIIDQLKKFDVELPKYCIYGRKVFETFGVFLSR